MTPDKAEMEVIKALDDEYISKTNLRRKVRFDPTDAIKRLTDKQMIETISVSGNGPDHFRLSGARLPPTSNRRRQ